MKLTTKYTLAMFALILSMSGARAGAQVTASSQTVITSTLGNATGIAVDPIGNLYAADGTNNLVTEVQGSNAAPATLVSGLSAPQQVAVDASRNLYIADGTSKQVVEIPYQSGALNTSSTTKLGNGLGTVTGVAVDLSGNVYIVDATNKQVVKISGTTQTTLATGTLVAPKQVAVDRLGNVYIADSGANAVIFLPVGGGAASTVGSGLNAPQGVATDSSNNVYIADTGNGRIVEVPFISGAPVTTSQVALLTSSISSPVSLALDTRGTVYIASQGTIYRYSAGSAIYFGLLPVGTASQTFPVTISFSASVAPSTIKVVTTGITGLDYADAGSDTCTIGTTYSAGNTCKMNVTFTPAGVGPRYGAIVMYNATNQVVARVFLGGGGLGALLTVDPGTLTTITPSPAPTPVIAEPRSVTRDAAGNLFMGEYTNGRVFELRAGTSTPVLISPVGSNVGANGVSINGAGDLLIASGGATIFMYPYENGTWNPADQVVLGSGYSKTRVVRVDVAGNAFYCDASNNKEYEVTPGNAAVQLTFTPNTTECVGTAVDLYGNLAFSDSSTGAVLYVPATGAKPYETGSGYTSAWGVAFDASGSLWVSASGADVLGRIPNENGTLNGADQVLSTVGNSKNFDIWLDNASGNLYFTQDSTSAATFGLISRTASALTWSGTTAIGATNTTTYTGIFSNSGNETPTYTNGGIVSYNDIGDFPSETATSPACTSTPLITGFTCKLAFGFEPHSSGTRTASVELSSNSVTMPAINLTGTASGTVTGTATLAVSMTTPASGKPAPYQAVIFTATLAGTSGGSTPTGTVALLVDGVYAGQATAAATMTFSVGAGLSPGFHTATAKYSGDANYQPTTAVVYTGAGGPTTSTTTLAPLSISADAQILNQPSNILQTPVTLSATVTGTAGSAAPTGTVIFFDGTTQLAAVTLSASGTASYTITSLALGVHSLTAVFAGNVTYATSVSAAAPLTVVYPGDFTLSATPASLTVTIGTVGTAAFTATPITTALGGLYSGTIGITFDCSTVPVYATCAFQPAVLTVAGAPVSGTLSIITEASFARNRGTAASIKLCLLPIGSILLLLGTGSLRRKKKMLRSSLVSNIVLLLLLGVLLTGATACGSHETLATPAGTYQITITAVGGAGTLTHSITIPVIIQK